MKRDERFEQPYYFVMENMECRWLHLFKPDEEYAIWKVDAVLDAETAKEMAEVGFNVLTTEVDGRTIQYVRAFRHTHTREGKPLSPPRVVDADLNPFPEGTMFKHGTICNLSVFAQYKKVSGVWRLPLYLQEVQVVKPLIYNPSPFKKIES